jgi:hypothetical protein
LASALSATLSVADGDGGGEAKKAGPIALVVILVLCVACYFLFRSMTRHLRKVREEFPSDDAAPPSDRESPTLDSPAQPTNGKADQPPP